MDDETMAITELVPDDRNARTRTERGYGTLERSLIEFGGMRSVCIDETNRVLAGNGTVEAAIGIGMERVRVIETDGKELIAVRRSGLSKEQKMRYAIADNRTSELAEWDIQTLAEIDLDVGLSGYFTDAEIGALVRAIELCDDTEPDRIGDVSGDFENEPVARVKLVHPGDDDLVFEFDPDRLSEISIIARLLQDRELDVSALILDYLRSLV